ncbi:MAG TPA: hypothetical protein DCG33_08380 [Prevotellaceae bacterium]|nr:hypothetical protein [Prevotellaceae bacterium]
MSLMKKLLFCLTLLLSSMVHAEGRNWFSIHLQSGACASYAFSEEPSLTYESGMLVLTTNNVRVEYATADITKMTFDESDITGIKTVQATVESDGNLCIYNLAGVMVRKVASDTNGATVNFDNLPSGTYIVKSKNVSYKIIKQ